MTHFFTSFSESSLQHRPTFGIKQESSGRAAATGISSAESGRVAAIGTISDTKSRVVRNLNISISFTNSESTNAEPGTSSLGIELEEQIHGTAFTQVARFVDKIDKRFFGQGGTGVGSAARESYNVQANEVLQTKYPVPR